MGPALPIIMAVETIAKAGLKVASGIAANNAAKDEANALQEQAKVAAEDSARQMDQHAREVKRFAGDQAESFLSSGVTMDGSPAEVLAQTRSLGQQELNVMRQQGNAQAKLYTNQANKALKSGRMALIGSLIGAGTGLVSAGIGGTFNNLGGGGGTP